MTKLLKNKRGFTLIELLIAVAIITILSTAGITSFNNASRSNSVKQQTQEIKTLARKMQNEARAGAKVSGSNCASTGTFYGTYITFSRPNEIYTGTACFNSSSVDVGTQNLETTPQNVSLNWTDAAYGTDKVIAFYSFDGGVYFFKSVATKPTKSDIDNPIGSANRINPQPDPLVLNVCHGSDCSTSPILYRVNFNSVGVICEQKGTSAVNCAD